MAVLWLQSVPTCFLAPSPQLTDKRLAISRFMLLGNPMVVLAGLQRNMATGQPGQLGDAW